MVTQAGYFSLLTEPSRFNLHLPGEQVSSYARVTPYVDYSIAALSIH